MDPISLAVGAVLLGIGYLCGRLGRARRVPPPKDPYRCGCTHHLAAHDPKTNACNASVYKGSIYGYQPCACKQYVGERPVTLDLDLLNEQADRARRAVEGP